MSKLVVIKRILKNPKKILLLLGDRGFFNWLSDVKYLKLLYQCEMDKKLNLEHPHTFNEKLQWLKLYDRQQNYTNFVDKYKVRNYIKETIGPEYLIPLIATYENVDQINWDELPDKFVLKCNHGSGSNIICSDKNKLDFNLAEKKLKKWMSKSWYWFGREWPYKNIKPLILAEEYIVDESNYELKDYKIMCFNGKPKIIQVMSNRASGALNINHYDTEWTEINIERKRSIKNNNLLEKPKFLDEMLRISERLSRNIPFVRIDLYNTGDQIFFGEMTFYPTSGFMDFVNKKDDYLLGSWIELPQKDVKD